VVTIDEARSIGELLTFVSGTFKGYKLTRYRYKCLKKALTASALRIRIFWDLERRCRNAETFGNNLVAVGEAGRNPIRRPCVFSLSDRFGYVKIVSMTVLLIRSNASSDDHGAVDARCAFQIFTYQGDVFRSESFSLSRKCRLIAVLGYG
jgi:hypothetical protein